MTEVAAVPDESIVDHPLIHEMQDSYLTYSMSVIMSRALPDVRDGLKPSQRRILVAMNDLHLGPRAQTKKCSKISGDTSGNYHPHGDSVIYPTLVRMGQYWALREPLIDGQGNFGSIDGDPPAAMRYTEARMASRISSTTRSISSPTMTARARSRPSCRPSSPTCSSTVRPVSPSAWRPTSPRTTSERCATRCWPVSTTPTSPFRS